MKIFLVSLFTLLSISTTISFAQQSLTRGSQLQSQILNEDHSVTFQIHAPNAKEILLMGDFLPTEGRRRIPLPLIQGDSGVWRVTTAPLPSDLYTYSFTLDGMRMTDPSNAFVIRDVANVTNTFIVGGGVGEYYEIKSVPHGTVAKRWYDSPTLQKKRRITIYTPPGYEESKENYPVLYLMHGIGGDEEAWAGLGRASQILDNLIAEGKARPMIVVMTNGNVSQEAAPGEGSGTQSRPTFMLPNTMDGKFEESFIDIIRFVESNYRVIAEKSHRALAGLSMGGYHTNYISRHYPDTFDYMGLFSPALNNNPADHPQAIAYQNLDQKLLSQQKNGFKLYWIGIGTNDVPILYDAVQVYKKQLEQLKFPFEYYETDGGHTWSEWRKYLTLFVPKLFN